MSVADIRAQETRPRHDRTGPAAPNTVIFPELRGPRSASAWRPSLPDKNSRSTIPSAVRRPRRATPSAMPTWPTTGRWSAAAVMRHASGPGPTCGSHVDAWRADPEKTPFGFILSMECADPVLDPDNIHEWHEHGLRAIGITHYGANRYGGGTRTEVGLAARRPAAAEEHRTTRHRPRPDAPVGQGLLAGRRPITAAGCWPATRTPAGSATGSGSSPTSRSASSSGAAASSAWPSTRSCSSPAGCAACRSPEVDDERVGGEHRPRLPARRQRPPLRHRHRPRRRLRQRADARRSRHHRRPAKDPGFCRKRGYPAADIEAIMHGNWVRFFSETLPEG